VGGFPGASGGSSYVMDSEKVTWRKASYSGDNGGNCVEVGLWRKATHSGGNGGECVEVATADTQIAVRDSKDPTGPTLTFSTTGWREFINRAAPR
jgi:hypothetical protein